MTTPRVTVPVEPTDEMIEVLRDWYALQLGRPITKGKARKVLRRVLSAAPAPEGGAVSDAAWDVVRRVSKLTVAGGDPMQDPAFAKYPAIADLVAKAQAALATREEAPAEAGDAFLSWLEREIDEASCDIGAAHQEGGMAAEREKARPGILSDVRAEYLALRAQPPAREDALRVAVGALEFYADRGRWSEYWDDALAAVYDRNVTSEFGCDEGEAARQALAALQAEQGAK